MVEFEQETDAQKLLCEKDKQILNGKKLLVKPRKSHSEQDDSEKKHDGKGKTSKDEDDAWWASQKKILEDAFSKCKNVRNFSPLVDWSFYLLVFAKHNVRSQT